MDGVMQESDIGPNGAKRHFIAMTEGEEHKFLKDVRHSYHKDVDADRHNITPAREDMQFVIGDQWDQTTKNMRTRLRKPVLTVNRLPAFVGQFLGSWQQTDANMKMVPVKGRSKRVAEIRQGMIRSILRDPIGKHAQYTAMATGYICGIGNFGLEIKDSKYDVFAKDIGMVPFEDPFQVIWDRSSREPTGADAKRCYAMHYVTKEDYEAMYPGKAVVGWFSDDMDETAMTMNGFELDEMIRVCHFWQMHEEDVVLGLERDTGDVIDVTDMDEEQRAAILDVNTDGEMMVRETVRPYAECYVLSGSEVLDGPFRLNIPRVPIFRVQGWTLQEASVKYRWGFVRNSKDPQRLHNYWRSILAEELMKSNASKWLLDQAAMKSGLADHFRHAHLSGDNVLFWDSQSDGAKPEQITPPLINQAVLTEAGMTVQDIKDVTNKHEASLGVTSNEVSGRAINARQRVSELGDRVYLESMNLALTECARCINELIPEVYDTARAVKVMGQDDQFTIQTINDVYGDETPDITKGKYEIFSEIGPSYATKREESVDTMMTMMNHMPQTAGFIADIIARNMDIPAAEEISERLMQLLPPGMVNPEYLSEEAQADFAQRRELAQQQQVQNQQNQMQIMRGQFAKLEAEIAELMARAARQEAQAAEAASKVGVDAYRAAADYEVDEDRNLIAAAAVGVQLDRQDKELAKTGMDAAFRAAEIGERAAAARAQAQEPSNEDRESPQQ